MGAKTHATIRIAAHLGVIIILELRLFKENVENLKVNVFPSIRNPNGSKSIGKIILSDCQFHKNT